jgi:methylmalonyl-CoA epimerase
VTGALDRTGRAPQGWSVTGVHHVAFAHEGPSTLDGLERLLGLTVTHVETGEGLLERMITIGDCSLQLLESTGAGVVGTYLDRKGPGLHHLALRVDDVDAALADLGGRGVNLVDTVARTGGGGTRIGFVHPHEFGGLLVELVEDPS